MLNRPETRRIDVVEQAVLRDGSIVLLRFADPGDHEALARFFHGLTIESLRRRFFGPCEPSDRLLDTFSTSSDPKQAATLLALRAIEGATRPIAVGSYFRVDATTAEVAFAVDDRFQANGLGTMLLERLATLAAANGFTGFEAVTLTDNAPMLDMLQESGFEMRIQPERGVVTVHLSLTPTVRSVAAASRRYAAATAASQRLQITIESASNQPPLSSSSAGSRTLTPPADSV
jgi:GNAT superfamily N-acetyltransferase